MPSETRYIPDVIYMSRSWQRQKRPYNKTLPYFKFQETGKGCGNWGTLTPVSNTIARNDGPFSPLVIKAQNKALERFRDRAQGESASLLTSFGEGRQSLDMISRRVGQLASAVTALRKGNFSKVKASLGWKGKTPRSVRSRQRAGDVGGAWLEYWMGWAPLVGDVNKALKAFDGSRPVGIVRASAHETGNFSYQTEGPWYSRVEASYRVDVRLKADVGVSDGMKALHAQLGLNSYAATAYELVPWSWMVDWAFNIGSYLRSSTWFDGLVFYDSCTVIFQRGSQKEYSVYPDGIGYHHLNETYQFSRNASMPPYRLVFDPPSRLSLTRAATSVSLLLQQLSKVR